LAHQKHNQLSIVKQGDSINTIISTCLYTHRPVNL